MKSKEELNETFESFLNDCSPQELIEIISHQLDGDYYTIKLIQEITDDETKVEIMENFNIK